MQLRASRSGASSGSGKEGWLRRTMRREVTARMSVSRLARLLSRVRRMSAGEKSEKTSSVDSGSSQNWRHGQHSNSIESNEQSIRQSNKRHRRGFAWAQTGERRLA
jgi:hypothetical protein